MTLLSYITYDADQLERLRPSNADPLHFDADLTEVPLFFLVVGLLLCSVCSMLAAATVSLDLGGHSGREESEREARGGRRRRCRRVDAGLVWRRWAGGESSLFSCLRCDIMVCRS